MFQCFFWQMDVFKNNCPELELQRIWDFKKGRHNGTTYVLAIIFIFAGANNRCDTVKFIGQMKNIPSKKTNKRMEGQSNNIIDNVWVRNLIFWRNYKTIFALVNMEVLFESVDGLLTVTKNLKINTVMDVLLILRMIIYLMFFLRLDCNLSSFFATFCRG